MYLLTDGTEVNEAEIEAAFKSGRAVLVYGRAENRTSASLMLDGVHFDTRGECHSMWEEVWTATPDTLAQARQAARC